VVTLIAAAAATPTAIGMAGTFPYNLFLLSLPFSLSKLRCAIPSLARAIADWAVPDIHHSLDFLDLKSDHQFTNKVCSGSNGYGGGGYGGGGGGYGGGGGGGYGGGGGGGDRMSNLGAGLQKQNWGKNSLTVASSLRHVPYANNKCSDLNTLTKFEKSFYKEHEDVAKRSAGEIEKFRREHSITVAGKDVPAPVETFDELIKSGK
jgi:hypothetical protein